MKIWGKSVLQENIGSLCQICVILKTTLYKNPYKIPHMNIGVILKSMQNLCFIQLCQRKSQISLSIISLT